MEIKMNQIMKILVMMIFKTKYNKNKQIYKSRHKYQMSLSILNKYNIKTLENLQENIILI